MRHNPSTDRTTQPAPRLEPVPVGLFLASTHRPRRAAFARPGVPDWHGLSPSDLAHLIRRYSRPGDVVLDLDEHPAVVAAASYLRRAAATLATHRGANRVRLVPPPGPDRPRRVVARPGPGANLVLVTLPRAGAYSLDLHGMTRAMSAWRRLLRPGGHLITALTASGPELGTERGTERGAVSHRSTVIAAARAAGLLYHQHLPVLLVPLPEHDPPTDPHPADESDVRLSGGRHLPAFRDLLAFAGTTTSTVTSTTEEATRG